MRNQDVDHRDFLTRFAELMNAGRWEDIPSFFAPDAVLEFPQSSERFRGRANIEAQFANYPELTSGRAEIHLHDVVGGAAYQRTPMYTVVQVEGSGDRGTAVFRSRYPDGSEWWIVDVYELRDGLLSLVRVYFAPEFAAAEWRAPYREQVSDR
jgi:ketosteroid isomerase-like protein